LKVLKVSGLGYFRGFCVILVILEVSKLFWRFQVIFVILVVPRGYFGHFMSSGGYLDHFGVFRVFWSFWYFQGILEVPGLF
jgi:hypothetical protein